MKVGESGAGRRRVAFFLPDLAGGGAERALITIAGGLSRRIGNVALVVGALRGPYVAEIPRDVYLVDLGRGRMVRAVTALAGYIRRERPSVLISTRRHGNVGSVLARTMAGRQDDCCLILRESNLLSVGQRSTSFKGRALYLLARLLYPLADGILVNSSGLGDDLAHHIKRNRPPTGLLRNPLDLDLLDELAGAPSGHPWFEDPGVPVVMAAGRLTVQKGFDVLIRAIHRVQSHLPVRLVIFGEGPARLELHALVRQLSLNDHVDLPGFDTNPFRYMARADLFALSSRWEGSPNVLIQALACGCPVVGTDCVAGPRETLAGGRYGRLVPVDDEVALAGAIIDTLRDGDAPAEARQATRTNHALDRIIDDLLAFIDRV